MVASPRHETLGFVLSVRTLEALHRQHSTLKFLCHRRAAKIFKSFSMQSLDLLVIRKHDKVCDEVLLEQCVPIDRQSWTPAPSANAAENCERIIFKMYRKEEKTGRCNTAQVTP